MFGIILSLKVEKMEALDCWVLKKEKWVLGEELATPRMMARSGPAWVPKGKARTATWASMLLFLVVLCGKEIRTRLGCIYKLLTTTISLLYKKGE